MRAAMRWYAIDKERLLDLLLGEPLPGGVGGTRFPASDARMGKVIVGYSDAAHHLSSYAVPSLVVVDDHVAANTMSWLHVYATEVFPVSQFARLLLASEWFAFGEATHGHSGVTARPEQWASVAVGEALSQSDDVDLEVMPLSRLASCISIPLARTTLLFGQDQLTRICVDRLRAIGPDRRFGRRQLAVDELIPIWAVAGQGGAGREVPASQAAMSVINTAATYFSDESLTTRVGVGALKQFPGLLSDSIEERVVAFNNLSSEVLRRGSSNMGQSVGLILAAGAFLVGRGTSHLFLLQRLGQVPATAYAWFGAMAAVAGVRAWDAAWLRAVKGVERLLRPTLNWEDVVGADIGWAEWVWLTSTSTDLEAVAELPRMLPGTVDLEVVPGARLLVRLTEKAADASPRSRSDLTERERALQAALGDFLSLAYRVRGLVEREQASPGEPQKALTFGGEVRSPKGIRTRKPR